MRVFRLSPHQPEQLLKNVKTCLVVLAAKQICIDGVGHANKYNNADDNVLHQRHLFHTWLETALRYIKSSVRRPAPNHQKALAKREPGP
jgi:hypothetical protein